jgi:hypothetical protein
MSAAGHHVHTLCSGVLMLEERLALESCSREDERRFWARRMKCLSKEHLSKDSRRSKSACYRPAVDGQRVGLDA